VATSERPQRGSGPREASPKRADDAFVVRALSKGLLVLSLFDGEHREWTLEQITEQTGLPRMTAYRMLRTMESSAYVVRDTVTNRYHLGPAMLAAMYLSEGYSELERTARPYLEALANETGESVTLAVEVDGVAVAVDMIDTSRPFRREIAPGQIIGYTANANGKVFAAFKAPAEREMIADQPLTQLTPNTIAGPQALLAELERVEKEGIGFDLEERNIGTCAVAAPVRDQLGTVIATVSVVVPTGRFGPDERTHYAESVRATATSLSAFLGYSPPKAAKTTAAAGGS
jgi:DNA-binding IclR family transcriptional regulator